MASPSQPWLNQTPPAPPLFHTTAESLVSDARRLITRAKSVQDAVVRNVTPETATLANTILPLVHEESLRLYERQVIAFYGAVSTDPDIREASYQAEDMLQDFDMATRWRKDLWRLLHALRSQAASMDAESRRWLEQSLSAFEKNGLALSQDDQARLLQLDRKLNGLKKEYLSRCAEGSAHFCAEKAELEGLEPDFISGLEVCAGSDEVRIPLGGIKQRTIMHQARRQNTRRAIYLRHADHCIENVTLLQEAILLRKEKAQLLGYRSYSHLNMAGEIEKSPETVQIFLADLADRLSPAVAEMVSKWKQEKRRDLESRGEHDDGKFYEWDRYYYSERLLSSDSSSADSVAGYFSLSETVTRMLRIFEDVLRLKFIEVEAHLREATSVWHEDVQLFTVWDISEDGKKHDDFLGYLYMDMYFRPGKRSGYSDLPIRPGFTDAHGHRHYPSTAMVCNFSKPTENKPCLLEHEQIVLVFHELGHAIHDLVAHTKYAVFHGASCADFNEVPSQMLEEWCWDTNILKLISCHYSTLTPENMQHWRGRADSVGNSEPLQIPTSVIDKLIHNRKDRAITRCIAITTSSSFEMIINSPNGHGAQAVEITKIYHSLLQRFWKFDVPDDLPAVAACQPTWFTVDGLHVYLTSQVYAMDLYDSVFKHDPLSREQGLRYRRSVIEHGSSKEPMEMMTDFIGRSPRPDAFYANLGLL